VLDTATRRIHAHIEAAADGPGYARMLDWARQHAPGRRVWALEGTGSFAAGLAGELALAGEDVVEVGALTRARGAKNDRLDAVRAAGTAWAREHQSSPRVGGLREATRALSATRQAVLVSRTKAINELKSLIVVAHEQLWARLRGRPLATQLALIESMVTTAAATVEHRIMVQAMQSITARIRFLGSQLADIDPELVRLIQGHLAEPALLAEPGVGPVVAAPTADQLVPPRTGQKRSGIRLAGRSRTTGSQQRPMHPAPPHPRWGPDTQPSPAQGRDHTQHMPRRNPSLRSPPNPSRQDPP
jgi:transposase